MKRALAASLAGALAMMCAPGSARADGMAEEDAATAADLVQAYGLPDAAVLAAGHRDMVRIFMTDGGGVQLPSLVYEWSATQGLVLEVRPTLASLGKPRVLRRRLPRSRSVQLYGLRRSLIGSPLPGPPDPPADKPENFVVCIHATWGVIETIQNGHVDRRVRDACHIDDLLDRALTLSREAIEDFPECTRLTVDQYRSNMRRLASCMQLHGEIGKAVEVRNRLDRLIWPESRARDRRFADLFAPGAVLVWPGRDLHATQSAAEFIADRPDNLWPDSVAVRGEQATVKGRARHFSTPDEPGTFEAAFVQTWSHEHGGWRITSWTTQAFVKED